MAINHTTYSFQDVNFILSHPDMGIYSLNGEGMGSVTVTMTNDVSIQDVGADGHVMVSKIKARNGTLAISAQQTSTLHRWLTNLYNYLEQATTDKWAQGKVEIKCPKMGETIIATGLSFQKRADRPFQAQGQQVTWNLMSADIQQNPF